MATFVLIHGGRHGGWCWKRVAERLRAKGHDVYAPSLSGLGDRAHLIDQMTINLDTHIDDVTQLLRYEDLNDVVLVGHSYGGAVITGVADREPQRLSQLAYLDAILPRDGEAVFDINGSDAAKAMRSWIASDGDGARVPSSRSGPEFYGITDPDDIAWVGARLTDQPAQCYEQPLRLSGPAFTGARTYLRCTRSDRMPATMAQRVLDADNFELVDIDAAHDAMITAPDLLVQALVTLLRAVS